MHVPSIAITALVSLLVCACQGTVVLAPVSPSPPPTASPAAGTTQSPVPSPTPSPSVPPTVTPAPSFIRLVDCPVTIGTNDLPPGETARGTYFGNGKLWVELWPDGVVRARPIDVNPDGSIGMKFPFWQAVIGTLRIVGSRLDGASPPSSASIPGGYGDTGFQATGITFPAPGCWQLTASAGDATLTFVTRVVSP